MMSKMMLFFKFPTSWRGCNITKQNLKDVIKKKVFKNIGTPLDSPKKEAIIKGYSKLIVVADLEVASKLRN